MKKHGHWLFDPFMCYLSLFGLQTMRVEVPDHAVGSDAVGRRRVAFGQWAAVCHLQEINNNININNIEGDLIDVRVCSCIVKAA